MSFSIHRNSLLKFITRWISMKIKENPKAQEAARPNFQKQVIVPQIYDLQNIKLIQNYGFKESPVNKVAELKKKKIQSAIQTIINKQKGRTADSNPMHITSSYNMQNIHVKSVSLSRGRETIENDTLVMETDEKKGDLLTLEEENFNLFSERIQKLLKKTKHTKHHQLMQENKKQIEYFMSVISNNMHKRVDPEAIKEIQGFLDEINRPQTITKQETKMRAQSATVSRNASTIKQNTRLCKSRVISTSNLKQRVKQANCRQQQLVRSKQLISTIKDCMEEESRIRAASLKTMQAMRAEWREEGPLQKTFIRASSCNLTLQTLNLLKERRLKIRALSKIDNEYLKL